MTLGDLTLPISYEDTKGYALIFTPQLAARLAELCATLSVCNGNITVTMDATLTDAEREAIGYAASIVRLSGKKADRIRSDVMAALLARFE